MKRTITLLIENSNKEEITKLKEYCNQKNLHFKYRYGRETAYKRYEKENGIAPLYYFSIFGDTNDFNLFNEHMEGKLVLTDYAEICNIADLDDTFETELKNCLEVIQKSRNLGLKADRKLLDLIMPIKNVKLLEALQNYNGYMTYEQRQMIQNRIDIVSGEREKVDEEFREGMLAIHCDVKALRLKTNMNRKEFASYFEIPYRTVEDWENKKSSCSTYLFKLMEEKLKNDGLIKL